jgi:hypothetical protein
MQYMTMGMTILQPSSKGEAATPFFPSVVEVLANNVAQLCIYERSAPCQEHRSNVRVLLLLAGASLPGGSSRQTLVALLWEVGTAARGQPKSERESGELYPDAQFSQVADAVVSQNAPVPEDGKTFSGSARFLNTLLCRINSSKSVFLRIRRRRRRHPRTTRKGPLLPSCSKHSAGDNSCQPLACNESPVVSIIFRSRSSNALVFFSTTVSRAQIVQQSKEERAQIVRWLYLFLGICCTFFWEPISRQRSDSVVAHFARRIAEPKFGLQPFT